jgi:flagellum-specific ATP synthase
MAAYRDHEDLISIGAYRKGANKTVDAAIDLWDDINRFLRQRVDEKSTLAESTELLMALHKKIQAKMAANTPVTAAVQTANVAAPKA